MSLTDWINRISKNELSGTPGILHSFSGNIEQAKLLMDYNFYFGISGPVTFNNAENLKQNVAELPLDRILIETDAPFLTPHPRRGKRNEPSYVKYIAEKIAEIRDLSSFEIGEITSENSFNLFGW
jgi:TatD DNase family protein